MEAANGEEALDYMRNHTPDMMVLDIKLPDLTGWEILETAASDPTVKTDFPVLVLTASLGDANVNLDPYPSVAEIMLKPFKTDKLISTIQRILETKQE